MEHKTDSSDVMVRYLLGDELSAAEQDEIEESFGDSEFFERFLMVEDDLVDEYIHGRLTARELELFESNYLSSPRRREKVAVARTLLKLASPQPEHTRQPAPRGRLAAFWDSAWAFVRAHNVAAVRSALGVTILAFAILVYWLISLTARLSRVQSVLVAEQKRELESRRREEELRRQLEEQRRVGEQYEQEMRRQQAEHERREEDLQRELQRLGSERSRTLFASAVLFPSVTTRGSNSRPKVIVIGRGTRWLTLTLIIERPGDFNAYRVEITHEAAGSGITRNVVRDRQSNRVTLKLPAESLTSGNYTATVYGIKPGSDSELVEGYEFSITKR